MHLIESALLLFIFPLSGYILYWQISSSPELIQSYNDLLPRYVFPRMDTTYMSPSTTFSYDTYDSNNIGLIKKLIQNHYHRSAHLRKQTNTIDFSSMDYETLQNVVSLLLKEREQKYPVEPTKHYIDFSKNSWNRDYQSLMESIYNDYSRDDYSPFVQMFQKNGYSKIVSTNTFGFATNACYNIKSKMLILYDTENDSLLQYILSQSGQGSTLSFHDQPVQVLHGPMPSTYPTFRDLGLVIVHPQSSRNALHFVQSISSLLDAVSRPYLYPPINRLYITDFIEIVEHAWSIKFKYLLNSLFPEEFKLQVYDKNAFQRYLNQSSMICAHGITFLYPWQENHVNIFIGHYLSSDLLRASLYTRTHKSFYENFKVTTKTRKLNIGLLERRSKRSITNYIDLVNELASDIGNDHLFTSSYAESLTPFQQMLFFSSHDIIIATYGSTLLNVLFFEPHSLLIELMPEHFTDDLYQVMTAHVDCIHQRIVGEPRALPPLCTEKGEDSKECAFAYRDSDIQLDSKKLINMLHTYIPIIAKHKYDIIYLE